MSTQMDDLKLLIGELKGRMDARMDTQDKRLDDILEQTRRTNGRVTDLEVDSAKVAAAKAAVQTERMEVKTLHDGRARRMQWWVGTLIAVVGMAVGVAGALALLLP